MKLTWSVSPAIVEHFEVVNTHLPILESKIGRVDLRTLSLEKAEEIHKLGTRYLKKKAPKKVREIKKPD